MFSATYPPQVVRLAGQFLHEPRLLSLSGNEVHVAESEAYLLCGTGDAQGTVSGQDTRD